MCTGRVDLSFIIRAFSHGADGVFIGGCWPGECHYVTEGNYDALANTYLCKRLLLHIGLKPERLRLEWIGASEGSRFAEVTSAFVRELKELGPVGDSEGMGPDALQAKLEAAKQLVPYMKLVERERLRVPVRTEGTYEEFFTSEEFERLFVELIAEKLTTSQIMLLLGERPRSTSEICESLGLAPSDVSRHMSSSSRQGLVRYDAERKCYART